MTDKMIKPKDPEANHQTEATGESKTTARKTQNRSWLRKMARKTMRGHYI